MPRRHPSRRDSEDVPAAIKRAVRLIAAHRYVDRVSKPRRDRSTGCFAVTVDVRVALPRDWIAAGASPNGVRALEPATFAFLPEYPIRAPKVTLRDDFDRSLAHVQPGPMHSPVVPCLVDGDPDELLHAEGLTAIVNQLVMWLENAGLGKLIDPVQGWEPVRRDTLDDWIVAEGDFLRGLVGRKAARRFLPFDYLKLFASADLDDQRKDYLLHGEVRSTSIPISPDKFATLFEERPLQDRGAVGKSIALVVTPGQLPSGKLHVADSYRPETVVNLAGLRERAAEYGCGEVLEEALSWFCKCAAGWSGSARPLVVILCARRLFRLIGETSNIELVPYVTEITPPQLFAAGDQTRVFPAAHREAITPALLQAFSDALPPPEGREMVLLGCGSLGSKIAVHLARSGGAPATVVDKRSLSPHNAARHALLPQEERLQLGWLDDKAHALAAAIKGLGQPVNALREDARRALCDVTVRRQLFPRRTWAVLNATASLAVREALAAIDPKRLRARVIEASLFGGGAVGVMTVEGPGRNPNTADLIAEAYERIRTDGHLRTVVFAGEDIVTREGVGQGCASTTIRTSDARISLFAAAIAEGIRALRQNGLPENCGRLLIGTLTDDGMGLAWLCEDVPCVQVIPVDQDRSWTVRVAEGAHRKIVDDCAAHPCVETGGIIVGRISEALQAFLVTDILPAPADSHRSASKFVLGTRGVHAILEAYMESCHGTLYCLVTWHFHLADTGPSEQDWATAAVLA